MSKALLVIVFALGLALPGQATVWTINPGFPFSPSSITVTAGDTIRWVSLNGHNVAETSSSLPGSGSYNGGFRSGNLNAVTTFDWTAVVGSYNYFCEYHGPNAMYGFIHVQVAPTATITPTLSPTPSISPTFSHSPVYTATATLTPVPFRASAQSKAVLGPVPVTGKLPICAYYAVAPESLDWKVYSLSGDLVASLKFSGTQDACWDHAGVSPGKYLMHLDLKNLDGSSEKKIQKVVILP